MLIQSVHILTQKTTLSLKGTQKKQSLPRAHPRIHAEEIIIHQGGGESSQSWEVSLDSFPIWGESFQSQSRFSEDSKGVFCRGPHFVALLATPDQGVNVMTATVGHNRLKRASNFHIDSSGH